MLDVRRWLRQIGAAAGSTFAGTWAAVAAMAVLFKAELAAGEQALTALAGSFVAASAAAVWNWVRQAREIGAEIIDDLNVHFD